MVHPLQAEQQLGFPAGATAGASSLDTAAPTVSLLHSSIFFFNFLIYLLFSFLLHFSPFLIYRPLPVPPLPVLASYPISHFTATPTSHFPPGLLLIQPCNATVFYLITVAGAVHSKPRGGGGGRGEQR